MSTVIVTGAGSGIGAAVAELLTAGSTRAGSTRAGSTRAGSTRAGSTRAESARVVIAGRRRAALETVAARTGAVLTVDGGTTIVDPGTLAFDFAIKPRDEG